MDTGNQEVKENTEIFMSIRGNKEDTKASYTSRQYETQGFLLEYYLLEAKDLDKTQQAQVLQILDIYQRDITEEETEELDGVLEDVQMNGSLITVMLTTHAVYLLNSHD